MPISKTGFVPDARMTSSSSAAGSPGLFCALKLAPRPVTIVTAAPIGEGASSAWAQGGIAAAVAEGDTPEAHARDTIAAGAGLVDEAVALRDGARGAGARPRPARLRRAVRQGSRRPSAGRREAAHSARRIVHVQGDMAGRAIMEALVAAVRKTPSIRVLEGYVAEDLITEGGTVTGIRARATLMGALVTIPARAVVLASGGVGHLYAVTTNPTEARGHGLAIAARAGAMIADPEFVQFHPTAIDIGRDPAPLATEALRGEGAMLINRAGERFMLTIHPRRRARAARHRGARRVRRDCRPGAARSSMPARRSARRSPNAFPPSPNTAAAPASIRRANRFPIAPAAHYHMGGVATDANGRTSLEGLWAAGEVASTGAHGANRLASNSLLEAVVFAARIADDIARLPASRQSIADSEPTQVRPSPIRRASAPCAS